jgi:VCBS repeat-containing protein
LFGEEGDDSLVGGAGDDVLDGGEGNDTLDGGSGNDTYSEIPGSVDTVSDSKGFDMLDLSAAGFGVTLDLALTGVTQIVDTAGNRIVLLGSVEYVVGTSYADVIRGNLEGNRLAGAGGLDSLDGRGGDDLVQGGVTQVVYLDFDSAATAGKHVYTVEERNAIHARLEQDFGFPFNLIFTQTTPATGRYTTLQINAGDAEGLIGGRAAELDWRNTSLASGASVDVNGFLGRYNRPAATSANYVGLTATVLAHELGHLLGLRHADAQGPLGINPATGLPYGIYAGLTGKGAVHNEIVTNLGGTGQGPVALDYALAHAPIVTGSVLLAGNSSPTVHPVPTGGIYRGGTLLATFTVAPSGQVQFAPVGLMAVQVLGGTLNFATGVLTLNWSANPGFTQVVISYDYDPYRPGYRGADDAFETPFHIMSSPASLGTLLAQATGDTYFGERELIKLAYADAGVAVQEQAPAHATFATAQVLTLSPLAVPNLLPVGAANYARTFVVNAVGVSGSIGLVSGQSENDLYAFSGKAGDLVNLEIYSRSLARSADTIDSILRVYDSSGNLVPYYSTVAFNDDTFESQDAAIVDLLLPGDGIYYVEVDTFALDAAHDTDAGSYELFLYNFSLASSATAGGDILVGGAGSDTLMGATGDDKYVGMQGEDLFVGFGAGDISTPSLNAEPQAQDDSYTIAEDTPLVVAVANGVLSNDTDPDNNVLTAILVAGPTHGLLQLNTDGSFHYTPAPNFFGTDTFTYKASDGELESSIVTATITVASVDDAPTAVGESATTHEDAAVSIDVLTNDSDIENDTLSIASFSQPAHGSIALIDARTFRYTPANDYFGSDSFSYTISDGQGGEATATVSLTIVPVNDAPLVQDGTFTTAEETAYSGAVTATDIESDSLTFTVAMLPSHGVLLLHADGTFTYTPALNYYGPDSFTFHVSDGQAGGEGMATIDITPVNDAPQLSLVYDPVTVDEGRTAANLGTWSDADAGDNVALTASRGTITQNADGTWNWSFATADSDQSGFITIAASDGTVSTSITFSLVIRNVNPIITSLTSNASECGQAGLGVPVDIQGTFADAGLTDTHHVLIDWGDGTQTELGESEINESVRNLAGRHNYATGGIFTITVTLYDDDGGATAASTTALVSGVGLHDGVLTVVGTVHRDQIHVYQRSGDIRVSALFNLPGDDASDDAEMEQDGDGDAGHDGWLRYDFAEAGVRSIQIVACDGDDRVRVGRHIALPVTIFGGAGNDRLRGGSGNDVIEDLQGNNRIWAGLGNNTITAGAGNDRIWTEDGDDRIDAGNGDNEAHAGSGNDTVVAGAGRDLINSGNGDDLVRSGAGADSLQGGGGNDILVAGAGDDLVIGGDGRDLLIGGVGADRLVGDAEEDILIAGWTSYDDDVAALTSLMKEWKLDTSYASRTTNVVVGTGLTSGYRLVGDDGSTQTVFNDADVDILTGAQGQDWFLANQTADNGGSLDIVTDRSANEMWADTDF